MTPAALFQAIASAMFYQPAPEDEPTAMELWEKRLIQPIKQGKLTGYALAPAGYRRWLGHQQR
jgi:hypothetical protein